MKLTPHFTLAEFEASAIAARRDIDNRVPRDLWSNVERTALLLEEVRDLLKAPIIILSGYRSPTLNSLVGSKSDSKHLLGLAADFIAPQHGPPLVICRRIAESPLLYDQLIHEYGSWVHIGLSVDAPRRQELTICQGQVRAGLWPC